MKQCLAILGTNEYQNPLILRAKELGYETHAFGWKTGEIGEKTADFFHDVNITDYETLWKEIQKLNPVGVVSIASELAMHSVNYILRKMGIPCNTFKTEEIATNKYLMRCAMRDAGIPGPEFILTGNHIDKNDFSRFQYPLIVKPVDLSSSRGIMRVDSPEELQNAVEYALSWSKKEEVLVEEFIDGPEYSGESIAYQGKYKLLAVTEKRTTGAPHYVERGHIQPAKLTDEQYKTVEDTLYKAFASMGIEYGAIHPEFRITKDGVVKFMEIGIRMGGDCIGSDLVPLSTGYDYMGMVISIGCGKAPSFEKICEPRKAEIRYIIDQRDQEEYERVLREEPGIMVRHSNMKPLNTKEILKSADRSGYYITAK